jgi:hypothetical protein
MKNETNTKTMKLSTLVKIAREIERENKVTMPGTMNEMWARLTKVCAGVRTKGEARKIIATEVYDLNIA